MLVSEIRIAARHRKDMGDVASLAKSIDEIGLLHPVVVTPDGTLIAGERRLAAIKMLGWIDVPVTVIDLANIVRGEHDENVLRKDFTPSEAVAIGEALLPMEREAAKERQRTHEETGYVKVTDPGGALDRVASTVGMSRPTYAKAAEVVRAAEEDPARFGGLLEKMDDTGNVHGAFKELKRARREAAKSAIPDDLPASQDRFTLLQGDMREIGPEFTPDSIDIIITDPPYPQEYLPLYESLAKFGAYVLKPGGSMLVMVGQSYLPEILAAMIPHMSYQWTLAYLTPGGQSAQLWQRKVNTFWKPVLWFVKGEYSGDWIGDVAKSAVNDNDKRFHEWGQSESGMADLIERFTYPGQTILDPFCGAGTTGVVAVSMNRNFIGIDNDVVAFETAEKRLMESVRCLV